MALSGSTKGMDRRSRVIPRINPLGRKVNPCESQEIEIATHVGDQIFVEMMRLCCVVSWSHIYNQADHHVI